jgi:hypothetical protein
MNKDQLINIAAKKINAKSYLEIGHEFGNNFNKIEIPFKESMDPANDGRGNPTYNVSSNEYFEKYVGDKMFDIILIDGLHVAEQVKKDINNSLKHLNPNGIIFMHDCLPQSEPQQDVVDFDPTDFNLRPNGPKRKLFGDHQGFWTGNAWEAFVHFRRTRPDLYMTTVDTDWGVGVIFPNRSQELWNGQGNGFEYYQANRNPLMNVISVEQYIQLIQSI